MGGSRAFGKRQAKHWVVGRDAKEVGIRGTGTDPAEEDTYLRFLTLEVGAKDLELLRVGQLCRLENLIVPSHP